LLVFIFVGGKSVGIKLVGDPGLLAIIAAAGAAVVACSPVAIRDRMPPVEEKIAVLNSKSIRTSGTIPFVVQGTIANSIRLYAKVACGVDVAAASETSNPMIVPDEITT
jgi:hypothetical protein